MVHQRFCWFLRSFLYQTRAPATTRTVFFPPQTFTDVFVTWYAHVSLCKPFLFSTFHNNVCVVCLRCSVLVGYSQRMVTSVPSARFRVMFIPAGSGFNPVLMTYLPMRVLTYPHDNVLNVCDYRTSYNQSFQYIGHGMDSWLCDVDSRLLRVVNDLSIYFPTWFSVYHCICSRMSAAAADNVFHPFNRSLTPLTQSWLGGGGGINIFLKSFSFLITIGCSVIAAFLARQV